MTYLSSAFEGTSPVADSSALRQEFNGNTYRIAGMGLGNAAQPSIEASVTFDAPALK